MNDHRSTLPAEAIHKGHIRAYDVGTHKADVQLVASMPRLLPNVRVATDIPALDCVVGREVTILFFDAVNSSDAVIIAVQGALPSGGGGGVTDHGALTGLLDPDHPQYALLAGVAGGQLLKGGTAANEHLTLPATAHATRGYVRAQDDLQLLSNILRGSDGTARLTLAAASPHVSLTGDVDVSAHLAVGSAATPTTARALNVIDTLTLHPAVAGYFLAYGTRAAGPQFTYGLSGGARAQGTPSAAYVWGLYFFSQHDTPSTCYQVGGVMIQQQSGASGTGGLTIARAFFASAGYWGGSKPTTTVGLDIEDQGDALVGTAYGVRVADQTGTVSRLLELGPATPYLRLLGGANPPANMTNLYLKEQTTLRRVQWKDGAAIAGGDRVMVLV